MDSFVKFVFGTSSAVCYKADIIKERSFVSADDGGEHVVETSSLNTREIKEKIESWILQSDSIHADAHQPTNQILSSEA